jgi:hypothetical protein
VADR